jgi:radical SAM protein with 4Fe4S-binding SPASM domain
LFYNILKQCKEMKLLHLTLTGGEPMLHKNFSDFLKKCKEYNLSINILSNLTLLNDEIIEEMKMNSLLGVQVSLYSMDPKIHDAITQTKGSFKITKNAMLKLIENDVPLQISCPIMKQNINSYKDVLNWSKIHNIHAGCDYVIIARCDHTTQNLKNRLSINDIKKVINEKFVNEPKYSELMEKESEKKKNNTPDDIVCSVCHSSICISDNGNVYPCAGWQGYVVGNVNETSLKEIWNNSRNVQYLRGLRKRDFPKCIQCLEKDYCTMCMVRNANEHPSGNPLIVNDFFCNIAKINKKMVHNLKSGVGPS